MFLHVGNTLVTSLLSNVTFDTISSYLYMSNTHISYFLSWVDDIVTAAFTEQRMPINAERTPHCAQLEVISASTLSEFAIAQSSDELPPPSVLLDASPGNLHVLEQSVSCNISEVVTAFFALEAEDEKNRLVV